MQIKGGPRFCAVKYVHIFDGLKAIENEGGQEATPAKDADSEDKE